MAIDFSQITSLEGLSAEDLNELRTLAATAQSLFSSPETRQDAQRLMKKINPKLIVPELDQHDAVAKIREEFHAELDKRDKELAAERAGRSRDDRLRALRDNGLLDPDDVKIEAESKLSKIEKYMIDNGINNYDAAARLYALERQNATPTPAMTGMPTSPQLPQIDLKKDGANNITEWARQETHRAIADLRSGKVKLPAS